MKVVCFSGKILSSRRGRLQGADSAPSPGLGPCGDDWVAAVDGLQEAVPDQRPTMCAASRLPCFPCEALPKMV